MKKLSLVILAILGMCLSVEVNAQDTRYDKDKAPIVEKLWFGTGFGGLGLTNTTFAFGVSPIVGYKLLEGSSVGLRLPIDYYYRKEVDPSFGEIIHNNLNVGIGAFARQKLFFNIFAHAEFNHLSGDELVVINGFLQIDPNDNSKFLTQKYRKQEANVGLGYSAGNGGLSYEISIMYDVLEDRTQPFAPVNIRAGVNYNF